MAARRTLAAACAPGLAFLLSMVAEVALFQAIGGEDGFPVVAVLGAPPIEEAAKWLAVRLPGAVWPAVGLGFGLIEGGLKLWQHGALGGAIASVLLHGALAGVAARRGIGWTIPLHAAFNGLVVGAEAAGWPDEWIAAALALALFLAAPRVVR